MVGRSAQEGRQKRKPHRRGTPIKPAAEEPRRTSGSGAGTRSSGPRATRPAASGGTGPSLPRRQLLVGAAGAAAIVVGGVLAARGCVPAEEEPVEPAGPFTVHFVAVGDNLPEIEIAAFADAQAGEGGDGTYDYSPIYEPVKKYIESADLAYVKEETHVGGNEIGPRGYPSFNTTDEMADALVETGFDLVGSATNHAYDWGSYGANEHSREVWNAREKARIKAQLEAGRTQQGAQPAAVPASADSRPASPSGSGAVPSARDPMGAFLQGQ